MAYNMYKQVGKIQTILEEKGFKKDIPIEQFIKSIMIFFGMKRRKAVEWPKTFQDVDLIVINDCKVNFK